MLALLVLDVLFTTINVVSVAPLADILLEKPQQDWLGVTRTMDNILSGIGIDLTLASAAMVVWASLVCTTAVSILIHWGNLNIRMQVVRHLIEQTYRKLYNTSWEYFLSSKKSALTNSFITQSNRVGNSFNSIGTLVACVVRIGAMVLVPFLVAPRVAMLCIAGLAVLIVPFLLLSRYSYRLGVDNIRHSNRFVSLVRESLEGAREVLAFSGSRQTIRQLLESYDRYRGVEVKSHVLKISLSSIYEPVGFLVIVIVIVAGGDSVSDLSKLSIVLWGFTRSIPQVKNAIGQYHQLANTLPGLEQLREQQSVADRWKRVQGDVEYESVKGVVTVSDLHYTFPDGTEVLKGVSMKIPVGKTTCIVGQSGSGKSTLVDCITGLLIATNGNVFYDDVAVQDFTEESLRRKIAIVSQKPALFDLSIRDNILWANPEATEQDIRDALQVSNADEFIQKFEEGLETSLGESGIRLSGGQIQRIAIARALSTKPDILVLDEATNALDSVNESGLYRKLKEAYPAMTVVVIAHNLKTAAGSDLVFVMHEGQLVASGSYLELVQKSTHFERLLSETHAAAN